MIVVDTNLLMYAINPDAPHYDHASAWLERQLRGVPVGLPWLVVVAFLRLTTHARIVSKPMTVEQSLEIIAGWLALPNVQILHPGERHLETLSRLLLMTGTGGNLTNDAHIAAIAIENSALVCSADTDFLRFQGVQYHNPLLELSIQEPSLAYIA